MYYNVTRNIQQSQANHEMKLHQVKIDQIQIANLLGFEKALKLDHTPLFHLEV